MTLPGIFMLGAIVLLQSSYAAPASEALISKSDDASSPKDDLKTAASTYSDRYPDYGVGYPSSYGATGYGSLDDRYAGYGGYDSRYGSALNPPGYGSYRGGYAVSPGYSGGYGGYGGYAGNGGLNSYYGYENPYYQGANNHLGYGYYTRRSGSIYNSGITPSLVTGYRGYSRK